MDATPGPTPAPRLGVALGVRQIDEDLTGEHRPTRERHAPLDAGLLMRALHPRGTKEAVETVIRTQRDEPVRLDPAPASQNLQHRRFQVVVADPGRHPTEVPERPHMTVQEHLLALAQIPPGERLARRRHPHQKQRHVDPQPRHLGGDRPEVDLGFVAQHVPLRDHHPPPAAPPGGDGPPPHNAAPSTRPPPRRVLPPAAATPAGPYAAACAVPSGPPQATRRSPPSRHPASEQPAPHACGPAEPATTTPDAHPDDAPRTGAPAHGSTTPPAPAPCGSAHTTPPSTPSTCTQRSTPTTRQRWTPTGAKSDEHYRTKWGQLRRAHPEPGPTRAAACGQPAMRGRTTSA